MSFISCFLFFHFLVFFFIIFFFTFMFFSSLSNSVSIFHLIHKINMSIYFFDCLRCACDAFSNSPTIFFKSCNPPAPSGFCICTSHHIDITLLDCARCIFDAFCNSPISFCKSGISLLHQVQLLLILMELKSNLLVCSYCLMQLQVYLSTKKEGNLLDS